MSQPMPGGRRRIDRVLADDFLADLGSLDVDELRARRAEADQEETDLSFLRRMLQGRMDLLISEQRRRETGEEPPSLVDRLTAALADDTPRSTTGSGRHQETDPSRLGEYRRSPERLAGHVAFSDPVSLSDDALSAALTRLRQQEEEVSGLRRRVQAVADLLHSELGRRVADGAVAAQDLLPGS